MFSTSLARLSLPEELITVSTDADVRTAIEQLEKLHEHIQEEFTALNYNLNIVNQRKAGLVRHHSATSLQEGLTLALQYLRTPAQAVTVERLMGREEIASIHNIDARRHPVIEVRLSQRHFTVELVLSPDAWWDQQNLVGKLSVPRHRHTLYQLLQALTPHYRMGFWQGPHLSEMHLTANQFQHPPVMDQWQSTFEANSDWWRVGTWYDLDDSAVQDSTIFDTVMTDIGHLYPIYNHVMWMSDNNFRDFFEQD